MVPSAAPVIVVGCLRGTEVAGGGNGDDSFVSELWGWYGVTAALAVSFNEAVDFVCE